METLTLAPDALTSDRRLSPSSSIAWAARSALWTLLLQSAEVCLGQIENHARVESAPRSNAGVAAHCLELSQALYFCAEESLAALVDRLHLAWQQGSELAPSAALLQASRDCFQLLVQGQQAFLHEHSLPICVLLPCWEQINAFDPHHASEASRLLSLRIEPPFYPDPLAASRNSSQQGVSTPLTERVGEVERELLRFLRASDDLERRQAAASIAKVLELCVAQQVTLESRCAWGVLLAFTEAMALGHKLDLSRGKTWLASTSRQCLRFAQDANHRPPDSLLRELLYALADCSALNQTTEWVARAYRLEMQCTPNSPQAVFTHSPQSHEFEDCLSRLVEALSGVQFGTEPSGQPATTALSAAGTALDSDTGQERQWQSLRHHTQQLRQAGLAPALPGLNAALLSAVVEQLQLLERAFEPALESALGTESLEPVLALVRPSMLNIQAALVLLDSDFFNASLAPCLALLGTAPEHTTWAHAMNWVESFTIQLLLFEADVSRKSRWPSERPTQATDAIQAPSLQSIFLAETEIRLHTLRQYFALWMAAPQQALPLGLIHELHAIAGSAGTVGLAPMHTLALALEAACENRQAVQAAEHLSASLSGAIDALSHMWTCYAAGLPVQSDEACIRSLEALQPCAISATQPELGVLHAEDRDCGGRDAAGIQISGSEVDGIEFLGADLAQRLDSESVPDLELQSIFSEEVAELMPQLHEAMQAWLAQPSAAHPPAQLLRGLHTLKGSARMAGHAAIGERCHQLETQVTQLLGGTPSQSELETIHALLDALERRDDADAAPPSAPSPPTLRLKPIPTSALPLARLSDSKSLAAKQSMRLPVALVAEASDTSAELLIGSRQLLSEVDWQRRQLADLSENMARLRGQLRDLEIEAEASIRSDHLQGFAAEFDPLEFDRYTRVHELTRSLAESVADLSSIQQGLLKQVDSVGLKLSTQVRRASALQDKMQKAGTLPFASLEGRLTQAARQSARDAGRHVSLRIVGGELAVDRSILDTLTAPLEHLVRNSVAHGVESEVERSELGKPAIAEIRIDLSRDASLWQIEVKDDGRGLDLDRIRQRALALGLLTPSECLDKCLDQARLAELIFMPGFSTASQLTPLAGRGIGMDVVRSTVQTIGGWVQVDSVAGQHCSFRLRVPLTLSLQSVLLCMAGRHRISIASELIAEVWRPSAQAMQDAYRQGTIDWKQHRIPWASLSGLLGEADSGLQRCVLLLKQGERSMALSVDEIMGQRDLLLRQPGQQLLSVCGLTGASVLADGSVTLLFNPFVLWEARRPSVSVNAEPSQLRALSERPVSAEHAPLILVVDDSLTVRRSSQRLLERQGYAVALARDGLEALAWLNQAYPVIASITSDAEYLFQCDLASLANSASGALARPPALVLLDIEMPKMDGFELLAALRSDPRWQHLPVAMMTSRTATKHHDRAMQLGANAYVGKPYPEQDLIDLVKSLQAGIV